ncbi:MAG TPA: mechanosensitive ion channel family protein [Thermoanaerobaculia bacterium]|nr:mechanosensitive ion channel family protein [Thermoanaerobaculia bacterium]
MTNGARAPLVVRRIIGPLLLTIVVAGAVLLIRDLRMSPLRDATHDWGTFAIGLALLLLATRLANYLFFDVVFRLRRRTEAPLLLREMVAILVFSIGFALLLRGLLSVHLTAVLATSALITAVIGLALQDTLGNLFAGMALHLEKSLQVGDMVRVGEAVGFVEMLSWRAIRVRTLLDTIILLPNSAAARDRLEVFPRSSPAPIAHAIRIGLDYQTSPTKAMATIRSTAIGVPGVAAVPPPRVYIVNFADFSIVYELRVWLEDYSMFLPVETAIRERLWFAIKREGITIPYPVSVRYQYQRPWEEVPAAEPPPVLDLVELFSPLTDAERRVLRSHLVHLEFGPGEPIVEQGDVADSLFVVETGDLSVLVRHGDGTTVEVGTLGPGDAFGEMALLTGEPRAATVKAKTPASLYRIDREALAPVLKGNPQLAVEMSRLVEGRREINEAMLANSPRAEARVATDSVLAKVARYFGLEGFE